jgi:hypothetical protein
VYGLYLDDMREQVCRLPTQCVSSTYRYKKITIVLGLKSWVATKAIIISKESFNKNIKIIY